jgi:SAM-dependent methyltransferase
MKRRQNNETIFENAKEPHPYYIIDIDPIEKDELTITGDICSCPHVPSDSFDIILNDNLMEHVKQPWEAFGEMGRLLKSGGLCLTRTVFSWNYHPYPEDYWRFTHSALNHLGEKNGGLVTLLSGYAINNRRSNHAGGNLKNNLDGVPIDGYGGWLEGWSVFHIGQKV